MKEFKLKKVRYSNIMSVGDESIEVSLDSVHKTLVTGKNGAGKSTLLEAITFAMFGKPFRDIKKGQLINSVNKKNSLVELWMSYSGDEYYIKRGQKPNIFKIEKNGVLIEEDSSTALYQEKFEKMISMSYSSFKQIVVLGTAGFTPFMAMTVPNRRKLVEDLLEVSILSTMDKLNKEEIKTLNSQVQIIDRDLVHQRSEIETHKQYAERQKKLSGDSIERFEKMLNEAKTEAKRALDEAKEYDDQAKAIEIPSDPTIEITHLNRSIYNLETTSDNSKSVMTRFKSGGNCPTCKEAFNPNSPHVHEHESIAAKADMQIEQLRNDKKDLESKVAEWKQCVESFKDLTSKSANAKTVAAGAVDRARKVKLLIDEAKSEVIDNSDKILELTESLNQNLTTKTNLVAELSNRAMITNMLKDQGIKAFIINKYIPMFNKLINDHLHSLGADYSFILSPDFTETIKTRGKEDFSYASFSQGEKARIDISLLFTWREIASLVSGIKITSLFLDEVFDSSFDEEGNKMVQTILNKMQDTNVFIISHREHNPQDYGQHVEMNKIGRFTVRN